MKKFGPALFGIAWDQTLRANISANSKQNSKYFSVLIWGLGIIDWRKNRGSKISWHCLLKSKKFDNQFLSSVAERHHFDAASTLGSIKIKS
jgi:hypothetical protein